MWRSPSANGGNRKRQRPTEIIELLDSDSDSSSVAVVQNTAGSKRKNPASKKIIEKFLAQSANDSSVREAVALHKQILESDSDSSSTGSGLGKIWGLTSCKQENDNHSDSSSDSSIEVLSHPPSPRPAGMNGRYLSGRQRRLEIARSKNSATRNTAAAITSTEHSSDSSDDEVLFLATHRKALSEQTDERVPSLPTSDDEVATSAARPKTARKSDFAKRERIETSRSSSKTNKPRDVPSGEPKPSASATTLASKSGTARKSTKNKKAKPNEPTVFDNLFSNGKDFLHWTGITDPHYFLEHHKEFVSEVNVWRKDRNLPLFTDSKEYVRKLRVQIKNNLQRIGSSGTTERANRAGAQKSLERKKKAKQKRKKNQKTVYPLLEDLPMEGGEFVKYMGIKDIYELFKRNDLHKHVNEWRKKQNLPLVENERSRVAKWRKWIRQNIKYQTSSVENSNNEYTPEQIDFSNCMKIIEPLSKRFLNSETGLPVYQFAVYDTLCTDIIYEFRVEAKPSLIPNAGNGAFLTFLGAREASSHAEDSYTASEVEIIQPLVSKDFEGYHLNVKVVGDHLKESSKNIQYPPPTSLPPVHGSPEEWPVGDIGEYSWKLQSDAEKLLSHYEESPEIVFATNHIGCSVIEIGRYGPFRRSDRKYQLHYDLKNFVFSNEVSEWGFDVVEDLDGNDQVADVTDDTTGMPHHVTTQNICMYVNETAGDPKLKQTVWSGQVFDREVNYYFKTDTPMKKGETIELLISYFDTYDEIRERKGYGERNKNGLVRSDDHFAALLERNFVERYDMVEVIYEVQTSLDLYLLSEFLEGIRAKLVEIVDTFIGALQESSPNAVSVPYAQQIIALRRLNWLKPFFLKKIESFEKRTLVTSHAEKPALRQCAANAEKLDWPSWATLLDLLEKYPNLVDGKGMNVRSKFRAEVTEDICYGTSNSLICPCNEAVWCDAASTLTHDFCFIIARDLWNHGNRTHPSGMSEAIVKRAIKASEEIRSEQCVEALRFDADVWKRYVLNNRGSIAKEPRGTSCLLVLADDCKGPEKRLPAPYILEGNLSMSVNSMRRSIHKPWYLARQVLLLTDVLLQRYLANDNSYSIDTVRESIGLTPEEISMFLKRDIELDLESSSFYGTDFQEIYSKGNKLVDKVEEQAIRPRSGNKKKKKVRKKYKRTITTPVRKLLFWNVLIKGLEELEWTIERGNRVGDWYLLPPGVQRGKGFKPRVDFFDSAPLVIKCLKTDTRYCNLPPIKHIVKQYTMCQLEFEKMKALKSEELITLTGEQIVDHLLQKVSSLAKDSTKTGESVKNMRVTNFKVVFHTDRLGLLLHVIDGQVIVKGVQNLDFGKQINPGDALIAVGDHSTRKKSLEETYRVIKAARRPVTITFERNLQLRLDPSCRSLQS